MRPLLTIAFPLLAVLIVLSGCTSIDQSTGEEFDAGDIMIPAAGVGFAAVAVGAASLAVVPITLGVGLLLNHDKF